MAAVPGNENQSVARPSGVRRRRLAAGFTVVALLAGCVVLWVGVPILGVWVAGKLTSNSGFHLPLSLMLIIPGMFVVAIGLAWINTLWLRITGGEVVDVRGVPVRRRGPLEVMLPVCGLIALAALIFWFLVFAENPSVQFL
jgi:hypothetical protein